MGWVLDRVKRLLADLDDNQKPAVTNSGGTLLVVCEPIVLVGWREGVAGKRGKS